MMKMESNLYAKLYEKMKQELMTEINRKFHALSQALSKQSQLRSSQQSIPQRHFKLSGASERMSLQMKEFHYTQPVEKDSQKKQDSQRKFPKRVRSVECLPHFVDPLSTTINEIECQVPQMQNYISKRKDTISPHEMRDQSSLVDYESLPQKPKQKASIDNKKKENSMTLGLLLQNQQKVSLGDIPEAKSGMSSPNNSISSCEAPKKIKNFESVNNHLLKFTPHQMFQLDTGNSSIKKSKHPLTSNYYKTDRTLEKHKEVLQTLSTSENLKSMKHYQPTPEFKKLFIPNHRLSLNSSAEAKDHRSNSYFTSNPILRQQQSFAEDSHPNKEN